MATRPAIEHPPADLQRRVRAEFVEMPGLRLTASQAQCLFGLDSPTCEAVLTALVDDRFLSRYPNGHFAIASIQTRSGQD